MKYYMIVVFISSLMSFGYAYAYKHAVAADLPDGSYKLVFAGNLGKGTHVHQDIGFTIEKNVIKSTDMPGRAGHYVEKLSVKDNVLVLHGGGLCYNKLTLLDKNGKELASGQLQHTGAAFEVSSKPDEGCYDSYWNVKGYRPHHRKKGSPWYKVSTSSHRTTLGEAIKKMGLY